MRTLHRVVSLFVALFTLYLGVTGTLIQLIDLHTLYGRAPATDPDMRAIREGFDGPDGFAVITPADYTASALPAGFDYGAALRRLLAAAQPRLGGQPLTYAEIRMVGLEPTGLIESGRQLLQLDFATGGSQLTPAPKPVPTVVPSLRNTIKHFHRMTFEVADTAGSPLGIWPLWISPLVGLALVLFVITGLVMYFRMLSARRRIGKRDWFWSAGGWWRTLHRWLSVCAAAFILVVALSGEFLAIDSLYLALSLSRGPPPAHTLPPSPVAVAELPSMLQTTLAAFHAAGANLPLKVVRLRTYGGMPQGVLIAGQGDDTRQMVFDAVSGRKAGQSEPGYPSTGFMLGWEAHQIGKAIHRGSIIGMPGRWMDLLAGLSIVFLSVSGGVMYLQLWNRRRRAGRPGLVWT